MKLSSRRNVLAGEYVVAKAGMTPVHVGEFSMKTLLTAAAFVVLALSPASAKMMACTGANVGATMIAVSAMPDSSTKMGMNKELAMANTDMSNGKMRGACMHYMKAQKMMK